MKKIFAALCLVASLTSWAGFYSSMDQSIREAVESEFASTNDLDQLLALYDSIVLMDSIRGVAGCDYLVKGSLQVKREMVYFDACVVVLGARDFSVAVSERHIDD